MFGAGRKVQNGDCRLQNADCRVQNTRYGNNGRSRERGAGSGERPMNSATAGAAGYWKEHQCVPNII